MPRPVTLRTDAAPTTSRVLRLVLGGHHYAIRAEQIAALIECGPLRPVPRAPRAVLGLGEWRGNILTVLDLPHLLGHLPTGETECLVALARPMHRAALWPGGGLHMAEVVGPLRPIEEDDGSPAGVLEGRLEHEGELLRLIDLPHLTRSLERSPRERR